MRPPEQIETARLRLRLPTMDDAGAIFEAYAQDPEVTRYLEWAPHRNLAETVGFIARCVACWCEETAFPWIIERREDSVLLGMIELRIAGSQADFGYVLARAYWGNGYMPEAVMTVRDWVLAQPSIFRFWATCDVENLASARVLEKASMTREGVLRRWGAHPAVGEVPRDCACYAAVKE